MNILEFSTFYLYLFMFGKGVFHISKNMFKTKFNFRKVFDLPIWFFYPIVSVFFIGNFTFLFNFFLSGNDTSRIIFFISVILIIYGIKDFRKISFSINHLGFFIIPILVSISSYGIWLHYDAGMYHLNHQYWINESKIVFGLSNLNIWYSWSSIYEYISSYFWINENFIYLHYLNISFIVILLNFILINVINPQSTFYRNSSIAIILFSFLDNFGIGGGNNTFINIQTIGKPDIAFGVIFFISVVIFFNFLNTKKLSKEEFIIMTLLQTFLIQLKLFGVFFFPLYLIFLYNFSKRNKFNINLVFRSLFFYIVLNIAWFIKNFITTGCFVFPFEFTCPSASTWYKDYSALGIAGWGRNIPRVYNFETSFPDWFLVWLELDHNKQVFGNFLFSLIIIFIASLFLFKKIRNKNSIYFFLYLFFIIIAWLLTGANVRFGFGTWLLITSFLVYSRDEYRFENNTRFSILIFFVLISSTSLIPRLYSYQKMFDSNFGYYSVNIPEYEYTNIDGTYGVYPKDTKDNLCWIKLDCLWDKSSRISLEKNNNYLFFKPN